MARQLNWGGEGYATYEGYGKVSAAEQQAAAAQQQQAQAMTALMNKQFAQQQAVLSILMPQLTQMAKDPQGFGATAMAAMRSQTINTIGSQLASQQAGLRQQFATSNLAGLGSGAQAAISAGLGAGAAGAEASNLQQLAIANAQAQQQQQQFGLSSMQGLAGMAGSQGISAGGMAMQGLGQQFQEQQTMATQGSFLQNMALGLVGGVGVGLATGGLGNTIGSIRNLFNPSTATGRFGAQIE